MVYNREEAARRAEAATTNIPGYCQAWTVQMFNGRPVGDWDGDGAADAEDGWKSEPASARHTDRNPPRGVPVSYIGGSHDNGHRAVSLGNGKIRSTDAGGTGRVATVDLDWPERVWGLKYVGWSPTIDGVPIPLPPEPHKTLVQLFLESGPPRYDVKLLDRAVANGRVRQVKKSRDIIDAQVRRLHGLPGTHPRIDLFLKTYAESRVLMIGQLNKSIKTGRTGLVKDVRARIMREILSNLPRR